MKTATDVQAYLMKMELPYEEPRENTWMVSGLDGLDSLIVTMAGPVLVFRVKVMGIPSASREELRTLLELNATEMMHGAYGIEGDLGRDHGRAPARRISDYNEFAATVDDITLAGRVAPFAAGQVSGGSVVMGLFSRLGTLIRSNINDLISKAEDPEKMLSQVLVDMKNQLVEAMKQVAVAIGDEKRLKKQWDDQGAAGQGVGAQGHHGRARG